MIVTACAERLSEAIKRESHLLDLPITISQPRWDVAVRTIIGRWYWLDKPHYSIRYEKMKVFATSAEKYEDRLSRLDVLIVRLVQVKQQLVEIGHADGEVSDNCTYLVSV